MANKAKKTWTEKLQNSKGLPRVEQLDENLAKRFGGKTMLIPAPTDVDAVMQKVRKGKLLTIDEIRKKLASNHGAEITCPLTTGIFSWIASHAADEAEQAGRKRITPYWRTLKSGGELNAKYPGGIDNVRRRLEAEGHTVIQRGKRFFVESLAVRKRSG
ncbi:MAG: methylated DNA-protein cysteine methyltransferase [Planctomycetaceae bacterium]